MLGFSPLGVSTVSQALVPTLASGSAQTTGQTGSVLILTASPAGSDRTVVVPCEIRTVRVGV